MIKHKHFFVGAMFSMQKIYSKMILQFNDPFYVDLF